jgi:Protein of unknown function (DUF2934)
MSTKKSEHHHASHTEKGVATIEPPTPAIQTTDDDRSRSIRIRAHRLWEQAGKPDGDAAREQFWCEAEKEIMGHHGG